MVNHNSFGFSESITKDEQETIKQKNEIIETHDLREIKKIVGVEKLVGLLKKLVTFKTQQKIGCCL